MKFRSVVLVVVVFLISALSISVVAVTPKFGVKAGLSQASQTWEYSNSWGSVERDSRSGLAFGIFTDIPFTPIMALRLDALYVQKGSQITVMETTEAYPEGTGQYLAIKDRIDYMSLSLTGKANVLKGPIGIYLMGGPRFDIKIGENFEYPSQFSDSLYNSTVTGLVLGGGVETSIGPTASVLLEFRYDVDLTDAGEYSGIETDLAIKNKGFLILAGLRF